jgi:hypothetical protein
MSVDPRETPLADALELACFIAELQAGQRVSLPENITPARAAVYGMALLFHAADPVTGEADSAFVRRLQTQLEQQWQAERANTLEGDYPNATSRNTFVALPTNEL